MTITRRMKRDIAERVVARLAKDGFYTIDSSLVRSLVEGLVDRCPLYVLNALDLMTIEYGRKTT